MADGRMPNDVLHGEIGHAANHRYNDNRKRDITIARLDINKWETAASNRGNWRSVVKTGMKRGEERKRT